MHGMPPADDLLMPLNSPPRCEPLFTREECKVAIEILEKQCGSEEQCVRISRTQCRVIARIMQRVVGEFVSQSTDVDSN